MAFDCRKISLCQTKKTKHKTQLDGKVLYLDLGGRYMDVYKCKNPSSYQAAYLRYVNLTICKLYVSKKHFWYTTRK